MSKEWLEKHHPACLKSDLFQAWWEKTQGPIKGQGGWGTNWDQKDVDAYYAHMGYAWMGWSGREIGKQATAEVWKKNILKDFGLEAYKFVSAVNQLYASGKFHDVPEHVINSSLVTNLHLFGCALKGDEPDMVEERMKYYATLGKLCGIFDTVMTHPDLKGETGAPTLALVARVAGREVDLFDLDDATSKQFVSIVTDAMLKLAGKLKLKEIPLPIGPKPMTTKGVQVEMAARDLMTNFLYYDRKEDEDLDVGSIEKAIVADDISIDYIIRLFRKELEDSVKRKKE